jgi:uncharacterized membrane protein
MFEWSRPYAPWLYVVVVAAVIGLVIVARRTAISDRLRSWLLFIPRLAVFALLLFVLLNPVRRTEHQLPAEPAQVQFLVDASRSMALEQPVSRASLVERTITEVHSRLKSSDHVQLQLYRFGERLSSAADPAQLRPADDASRLAAALEQLPSRFARELPKAVVVFSDGAVDDAERLADMAADFRRLKVPVHVFPVGGDQIVGDVAIDELVVPPRVAAGVKAPIRGVIRSTGYPGQRIVLEVKPKDRPMNPPLATLPITLNDATQPFELIVEANPEFGELVLSAPPQKGEVTQENNRVSFELAKAVRKLKVIYMEGTGGTEYTWVRDALQEDKDIECLAMVADQQYVERPRMLRVDDQLRGFPATKEELFQYDCVICSDISLGAFTREQLDWTVELVDKRGGGFAMVGGITSFGAGRWDQTVWDQLIPIDMTGGALGRGWLYHNFNVKVPDDALAHPIWKIVDDPAQNRAVIAKMPMFLGTNYMQRLKPAATALAFSATEIPQAGIMPIFAAQPYGKGRTFAFAPDTTADWGRYFESQWGEGDNRYFRRFWRNIVRWLSENSVAGNKRLQVETDRVIYRAGQPIVLTAHAFDEQFKETTDYHLQATVKTAQKVSTPLAVGESGVAYHGELDSRLLAAPQGEPERESAVLPTREIEVIASKSGKEIARATAKVQILPDVKELLHPRAQPDNLKRLASAADGLVLHNAGEIADLLEEIPSNAGDAIVTRQPLWDSTWLWLLIVGLLGIEWVLRRLAGYG